MLNRYRLPIFSLLISVLLLGLQSIAVIAQPFDETKYPIADNVVSKIIDSPPAATSIDDYLINLAKAGDANFMADVTRADGNVQVGTFPSSNAARFNEWKPKFSLVMLDFTQEKQFSLLRYNADTFLFWKEPDVLALARKLSASTRFPSEKKLASATDLYKIISETLVIPVDSDAKGAEVSVPIKDLPPHRQKQVLETIQQLVIERDRTSWAWFEDSFWDNAFIRVHSIDENGKAKSALQIAGFYHGQPAGGTIRGLESP